VYLSVGGGMIDAAGPAAAVGGGLGEHAARTSTARVATDIDGVMYGLHFCTETSDLMADLA
jgi:hypothetical protein